MENNKIGPPEAHLDIRNLQSRVQYKIANSIFSSRFGEARFDKSKVANRVVEEFVGDSSHVFIGDGSSLFFVGLSILYNKIATTIDTNNVAIAHEISMWNDRDSINVNLLPGTVDPKLNMTDPPVEQLKEIVGQADAVILSAAYLFSDKGPVGRESHSTRVKRIAAEYATGYVIWAIDHEKLGASWKKDMIRVFREENSWRQAAGNERTYVVTTNITDSLQTPTYKRNIESLGALMGNRLIKLSTTD